MNPLLSLYGELTGVVLDYALSTPPSSKWVMCYGQALTPAMTEAAKLRQKLIDDGYPYGQSGSDPLVPDARGRTTAGKDNMGGSAANRLTTAGSGVDGATLGAAGGAQNHTLTTAQLAAHNHGVTDPGHAHGVTDPGHTHSYAASTAADGGGAEDGSTATFRNWEDSGGAYTGISVNSGATGISIQNQGSSEAHNNTQPTLVLNKIIHL